MTAIDVVGGVYGERCAFPTWEQIFGSAGRAAAALSGHATVRLHTLVPPAFAARVGASLGAFDIQLNIRDSEQFIGFDYLHCLSDPRISPSVGEIRPQTSFQIDGDRVVQFGMMECQPRTTARMCVYDPQSPKAPVAFRDTGSTAERLAIILNEGEAFRLTGDAPDQAGPKLLEREGAEVVVIKRGLRGAVVFEQGQPPENVPAFKTNNVFTIGSGDVFVAAFARAWMLDGMSAGEAAIFASKAAADYVETTVLPMSDINASLSREGARLKGGRVYLAGPFREIGQRQMVEDARNTLRHLGMDVFSPVHDIGHGPAEKVVKQDLDAVESSDAVFAILNGSMPGTLFEVGYARALGKPVFCVAQNMRDVDLKLPRGSGCEIFSDFVTALHAAAWRP